jgi:hypothetical protein
MEASKKKSAHSEKIRASTKNPVGDPAEDKARGLWWVAGIVAGVVAGCAAGWLIFA